MDSIIKKEGNIMEIYNWLISRTLEGYICIGFSTIIFIGLLFAIYGIHEIDTIIIITTEDDE